MKERDRVLELVKKGILSTEEALDLLESMATEKDEQQIEKVADELHNPEANTDRVAEIVNEEVQETAEAVDEAEEVQDKEAEDRENLERILDELATEANRTSVEIDEVNAEIQGLKVEIKEKQETLMELNTKEELDALSQDDLGLRLEIEEAMSALEAELAKLNEEKAALNDSLKNIRKDQWHETKESLNEKFKGVKIEIPEDWKEQANDTINQVGRNVTEASSQLGRLLKKTFRAVSDSVQDNVEWKDVNLKVPGVATTKFEHTFEYPATEATLIDVKVANGSVEFKTWDEPTVKVDAKIRLYGKMDADTPFDALMERSKINVDEDQISFQIPNKRVRADLVFYLPKRTYDHVSVKLLNGQILVDALDVKDIYMKSTNGNITIEQMNATMLEIEGVNGNITVKSGEVLDLIVETVNGTVTVANAAKNISSSLVNGDVRVTVEHEGLKKISASVVNGNVKLALPTAAGFDGMAKTSLGSINSRLTDYETVREKKEKMNQMLQFRRVSDTEMATIDLSTTTGNIFLKDSV